MFKSLPEMMNAFRTHRRTGDYVMSPEALAQINAERAKALLPPLAGTSGPGTSIVVRVKARE